MEQLASQLMRSFTPQKPYYKGPSGYPPLILSFHGGPASRSSPALYLNVQFWTSRGFAVAELNYTGSSGYGRSYRTMLDGHWGEYEADDAASCVLYLTDEWMLDHLRVELTGKALGDTLFCMHSRGIQPSGWQV